MFESVFTRELAAITSNASLVEDLCTEIKKQYGSRARYYHNLDHLDHLVAELMPVRDKIADWQTLVLAVAYHDIIYDPLRSDNEEKSAALASDRLTRLALSELQIEKCRLQIMATKEHKWSWDIDANYFTDADLAIFGADEETYHRYAANIRKEYRHYPDFMYKPGRQKVLRHFLHQESIYKTAYFRNKYERRARANIVHELASLS